MPRPEGVILTVSLPSGGTGFSKPLEVPGVTEVWNASVIFLRCKEQVIGMAHLPIGDGETADLFDKWDGTRKVVCRDRRA